MDTQGGMWLGTYFGGINYYHPLKNRFRNLQFTAKPNSLNSNIINCIREDAQKGLWIGTNGGGVNYYNPQTGKFTHYTQKEGLGSNDVKAIYIDEANKQVYIGTHTGGLSILHRRSGQIETYNRNSREKNIYAIEPTETGDFWMSGMSSILRFNPSQLSFSSITTQSDGRPFLRERVSNFFRDSKHRLWLISEKGLFAYTEQNGKLHNYPIPALDSISRKFINCLYEAHDGTFWIGTRSGICRLNEKSQEVTLYTTAHGLPNNVVHGILEDSYGKLWISTDKGISCLHPSTGKFRNFTNNDGLQSNQFTAACQRTADGQMYFGGINGITTFRPEEVVDNPYIPPVVITQLRLFNKIVFPDDETGILERNINETRSITFTAQQSMFSLEFVVSNYASGTHNTFAYKLDGYDKEWYYTNSQRVVSYSNLPQGTYRHHPVANAVTEPACGTTTCDCLDNYAVRYVDGDTLDSFTYGIYHGALDVGIDGSDKNMHIPLRMTNSAVALVLSPAVDSVETYIVNTAAGFSFADSTYDFSTPTVVRTSRLLTDSLVASYGVCFPSRGEEDAVQRAASDEEYWQMHVYVTRGGKTTRNVLSIREPLAAGEPKILKARISENGEIIYEGTEVSVTVSLDWKPGGDHDIEI